MICPVVGWFLAVVIMVLVALVVAGGRDDYPGASRKDVWNDEQRESFRDYVKRRRREDDA